MIPYVHGVNHALKKIVSKAGVRVVFSAYRAFIREQVNDYVVEGIIRQNKSKYGALTIVVDKPHHPMTLQRMVDEYRKLNKKNHQSFIPNACHRGRNRRHHVETISPLRCGHQDCISCDMVEVRRCAT